MLAMTTTTSTATRSSSPLLMHRPRPSAHLLPRRTLHPSVAPRASAADANSPAPPPASIYSLLAGTSVALGAAAIVAPEMLVDAAVGTPGGAPQAVAAVAAATTTVRAAGATLLGASAAAEWAMRGAIVAGRHRSATYARLAAALVVKGVAYGACALAVFLGMGGSGGLAPVVLPLYAATGLGSSLVSLAATRACWSNEASKPPLGGKLWPSTAQARGYVLLSLGFFVLSALLLVGVGLAWSSPVPPVRRLATLSVVPGLLLASATAVVQADAAERGRLGASTFVLLNKGLAVSSLALSAAVAAAPAGTHAAMSVAWLCPTLVVAAGFTAFQAVTAKKK